MPNLHIPWLGWDDNDHNVCVVLEDAFREFSFNVRISNVSLAAGGDEDVQGSTPGPETLERNQQSLAFDDALDDLQYLKMKEGPFYFVTLM